MTAYDEELVRWAKAGGRGPMPRPVPAQRRSGSMAEYRPRRDHLTERLMHVARYNLHEMGDRTAPLPQDIPLEQLLDFFLRLRLCEYFDRTAPGWDERLAGRRY